MQLSTTGTDAGSFTDGSGKFFQISRLDVNSSWPSEPAYCTLSSLHAGKYTSTSLFDSVVAVPGDEMPVVDDVLLTGWDLRELFSTQCEGSGAL